MQSLRKNKWSRYLTLIFGLVVIGSVLYLLGDIFIYVVIAWVLSMIGRPVVQFLLKKLRFSKLKSGPTLASILVMLLFVGLIWAVTSVFTPIFLEQAKVLANINTERLAAGLAEPLMKMNAWLVKMNIFEPGQSIVNEIEGDIQTVFGINRIGKVFSSIVSLATSLVFGTFATSFILFFFLKEDGLLEGFLQTVTPSKYDLNVTNAIEKLTTLLTRYFLGISIQILIISTIVSIGLSLLGVENAFLIAIFAALINVIPYLGPMLGAIFGMFVVISSGIDTGFYAETLPKLWKVAIVFGVVQLVDNFLLQPYIFSKSVLAHPLEIFIVILIGGKIGGVFGMVVAIPAYTVLRVIAHVFLSEFEVVQRLTTRMDEIE